MADSVLRREALASAAGARGWSVHRYDRERVFGEAAAALVASVRSREARERALRWFTPRPPNSSLGRANAASSLVEEEP